MSAGLRESASEARVGCAVHFASRGLATDNAVMIAAAAFPKWKRREFSGLDVQVEPNLALA